jgi:branched-chain amino acid transport system substrate-binding protein
MKFIEKSDLRTLSRTMVVMFALLFLLATLGSTVYAKEKGTPIKIGVSLSLTGKYAWTGNRLYEGMKTWAHVINEQGFTPPLQKYGHTEPGLIDGRPVKYLVYDDKSDPGTAVKLYQRLLTVDKVDLCAGPFSSAISKAVTPILERYKMPSVHNAASDPAIWRGRKLKWAVQAQPSTEVYYPGMAEIASKYGAKTAALVFEDTSFPTGLAISFRKQLEKAGVKIVLYEAYPKGISDWTPVLSKAWALRPDIIGIGGYEPDAIGLTKAAQEIKAAPKLMLWTVAAQSPDYAKAVGDACCGIIGESLWEPTVNTPGNKEFLGYFEKVIGTPANQIVYQQAMGYNAGQVLEIAVKTVGSLDLEKIRDVMFSLDIDTMYNHYKVMPLDSDDSGLQVGASAILVQWQKIKPGAKPDPSKTVVGNYVKEVIWPFRNKTADLIYPFPAWDKR